MPLQPDKTSEITESLIEDSSRKDFYQNISRDKKGKKESHKDKNIIN